MQLRSLVGIFLVALSVQAIEKKPVGDEFWEAAKAIRAAEVVLQDFTNSQGPPPSKETEAAIVDAATQLLTVSEHVLVDLRSDGSPKGSKHKKLALVRQLNRMGHNLRLHRLQHHRHRLSAQADFNVALKSIKKALAELKIAAWDAERRGADSASRAAAVVVADEARRLYKLTQNFDQEEHKVVAEQKLFTKVAAAINANLTAWSKVAKKHCRHHKLDSVGSHYGSLASAKKACEVRDNCGGVYQSGCSGFHFYLCAQDAAFEDSGTSCVYHKPSAAVPDQEAPVEQAAPEVAAPEPTIVAKAEAAQALAVQAKKQTDSLMDEAVAEVATAARNAEDVATTVYGKSDPSIEESVQEVEKASEDLKKAVLATRARRVSVSNATEDSTPAAPVATTTTTTTTTTSMAMVAKVDEAFDKLEASFKPLPKTETEEPAEGAAEQDLEKLVASAKEAPIARAFKIQKRQEEQEKEQVQTDKANEMAKLDAELRDANSAGPAVPSVPHHNLTPEEWKEFNAPDSTDAELNAAFEPLKDQEISRDTPVEHHNRLRTVAAAAEKAAEDARKEAEEVHEEADQVHEEADAERPRRRFRSATMEEAPVEPAFKHAVEDSAGIEVPAHQLAFEKAVGMTVEPSEVMDEDQLEERKHWQSAHKHHKHKHKKHHAHW